VFVNGVLVREIDQRHVSLESPTTEEIYIGGDSGILSPRIVFRLDGFGTDASGVELTDIELGTIVDQNAPTPTESPMGTATPTHTPLPTETPVNLLD
jgi:hypothetical protein